MEEERGFLLVGRVRGTKNFFSLVVGWTHAKTLGYLSLDVNIISSTKKTQIPFPEQKKKRREKKTLLSSQLTGKA